MDDLWIQSIKKISCILAVLSFTVNGSTTVINLCFTSFMLFSMF